MAQTKKTTNALQNLWQNSNFVMWFMLFLFICALVYILRSILLPFVLGLVLGYLFDPLASKIEKLKISRTYATILVFLIILIVAIPLFVMILNVVSHQFAIFINAAPKYIAELAVKTEPILEKFHAYFPSFDAGQIKADLAQNISQTFQVGGKLVQGLIKNGMAVFNVVSLMLITPVVAFYMLRDWDLFVKKADNLLPRKSKDDIRKIFKDIDRALSGFIRGQLSVCVILGTYYALALKIVGLELGVLVGFIAGLISFIPYVGSITGFVVAMMLAFSQFNDLFHIVSVIVVFVIGQFLEGNFLTPKLVGDKVGLHPVWVMFSLLAGGVLLGFLGLMIAVPVAAVIGILIRAGLKKYQKSTLYLEN